MKYKLNGILNYEPHKRLVDENYLFGDGYCIYCLVSGS
jgi:hypothetical protein